MVMLTGMTHIDNFLQLSKNGCDGCCYNELRKDAVLSNDCCKKGLVDFNKL